MDTKYILTAICAAAVLVMLVYYIRRERRIRAFLFGSLTGLAALLILNKYGVNFDAELPLNVFNLCGSAVLGVPFVICLVLLKAFMPV